LRNRPSTDLVLHALVIVLAEPTLLERSPLTVVTSTDGPEANIQFTPNCVVRVGVAKNGAQGGQLPYAAQDLVAIPASDVVAVGGDERIPLTFWQSEAGA
jgi:hypothetical protein